MKKVFMVVALALILASCNKEEKGAIEYLKSNLKSPSSFELVSIESKQHEQSYLYDTVYHITAIEAENFDSLFDHYNNVTSVSYDAMKIYKRDFYANTKFLITYDADNSFGAKIRENQSVYFVNGKYTMDFLDLASNNRELDSENKVVGKLPYECSMESTLKVDGWFEISRAFGFWSATAESDLMK